MVRGNFTKPARFAKKITSSRDDFQMEERDGFDWSPPVTFLGSLGKTK